MKKLVSELSGAELDYWVGRAEGINVCVERGKCFYMPGKVSLLYQPSTNPVKGWPIIEREKISIFSSEINNKWCATMINDVGWNVAETGLIAAMRCYVASVYGETVGGKNNE